jgi:hypothetical protein
MSIVARCRDSTKLRNHQRRNLSNHDFVVPQMQQPESGFHRMGLLPSIRFWCLVRGRFGAWTICGGLHLCISQTLIVGATVKAYRDADWWQDDPRSGSAVTDAVTGRRPH